MGTAPVLTLILFICSLAAASAQDGSTFGDAGSAGGGSYYDYSVEGGYNMSVNIWGFVRNPGKYYVPSATKLMDIISLAGGPSDRARLSDVQIVHDLTVDSTIGEPVVVFNMEDYKQTGDTLLNPLLYPNDTVIIPGDALNVFREVIGIISDVSLVVLSIIGVYLTVSGSN
jgi:hypothetical protein